MNVRTGRMYSSLLCILMGLLLAGGSFYAYFFKLDNSRVPFSWKREGFFPSLTSPADLTQSSRHCNSDYFLPASKVSNWGQQHVVLLDF